VLWWRGDGVGEAWPLLPVWMPVGLKALLGGRTRLLPGAVPNASGSLLGLIWAGH